MVRQRDLIRRALREARVAHVGPVEVRRANGIAAAFLLVFFFAHAALGALSEHAAIPRSLMFFIWFAVAVSVAHIALSAGTSVEMLRNKERPPSPRKRRHLVLKWMSGAALLVVAILHCQCDLVPIADIAVSCVLLGLLCVHGWIGARSLLCDLGLSTRLKPALRVSLCLAALAIAAVLCLGNAATC